MPKKKIQTKTNSMFQDLGRVINQVGKSKGIPEEALIEAIESAFLTAARKKWGYLGELEAHYNDEAGEIELFQFKEVTDNVEDPNTQMAPVDANKLDPDAVVGDSIGVKIDPNIFGRIAAQTAKQVIIQKVREAERKVIYDEYKGRVGELVTGIVRRFDKGNIIVDLGRTEGILPREEQVPNENFRAGDRVQGYFLELTDVTKGANVILSRKSKLFLTSLFEIEVPEIAEGIVEIKNAARDAGIRAKIAVYSRDSDVDPVGACVGMKGSRVQNVVQELKGEKIDIIAWDDDPARFVCNSLAPAEVVKVIVKERQRTMEVVVPDDQLSLAIGKRGQNVKLAAQLCGWNIDVYSETKLNELATRSRQALKKILDVDDSSAIVLYGHSYRNFEDIAAVELEDFKKVPGFNAEKLEEMYVKAKKAVENGFTTNGVIAEIIAAEEEAVAAASASAALLEENNKQEEIQEEIQETIQEETIQDEVKAEETIREDETTVPEEIEPQEVKED